MMTYSDIPSPPVTLAVLICTYNRADLLRQCLQALLQRSAALPDQVVIVNGGDERADDVVRDFAQRSPIRIDLIKTVNRNLAASRNVGLPYCQGDIIAMTDDDAEVFPDWIMQLKRLHALHPAAGAIGGAVIGSDSKSLLSRIADQVTFSAYATARAVRTLPGVNVSYKRTVVEQVGPQDETLFRGEDVDYNWRAKQLGYEIYYDPAVRVLHHHRPTFRAFLRQHYMYGRAYYLVRRKWPEMYCVYPHQLRRPKDFLKALNFMAAVMYEPLLSAGKLAALKDRLAAYPVMLLNQIAWRGGMVRQKMIGS
ncbi:Putative mycofactocin biosynthesis glycosyltransferase MftF [Anaerolineae bacterium]|nr:Putative mycofactocin biosynthesis glycosyltransferase MftF [Anaerolineae bacterium]